MTNIPLQEPYKDRLGDALNAEFITKQFADHYKSTKSAPHAQLAGCLDGNPPFDQAEMDKNGMSSFSNTNFRLLEADVTFACIPLYELLQEVPQYVNVEIKDLKDDKEGVRRYENILAENHRQLMKEWGDFSATMQLVISTRRTYGLGNVYFKDADDFRFCHAKHDSVRFASDTKVFFSDMEILEIVDSISIPELCMILDNESSEEAGWNTEFLGFLIKNACDVSNKKQETLNYWQEQVRHNSAGFEIKVPKIQISNLFVKEYDGKITHAIVVSQGSYGKYLYKKVGRFENFKQIYHPFNDNIGDGYLDGVKGLGLKCFNFRDAQNRLKNHAVDAGIAGSTVILQPTDGFSGEALLIEKHGPYSVLPAGLDFKQSPIGSSMDKSMTVDNMLERDLMRNIGGIRQNLSTDGSNPISATEATISAGQNNSVTKSEKDLFMEQLDALYQEQFRRLMRKVRVVGDDDVLFDWEVLLKEFQDRCIKDGVPSSLFVKDGDSKVKVTARRSVGRGSEYQKNLVGREILGLAPILPESVKVRHVRNHIANLAGSNYLYEIWPESEIEKLPTDHESKAQDENAGMIVGVQPIWTPTQNNLAHATIHIGFIGQKMQEVQQGFPVDQFLRIFQIADPHIQQTVQMLFRDNTVGKQAQDLWNAYQQLVNQVKKIASDYQSQQEGQAMEQQKLQQQAQTIPSEHQIKLAKVQADKEVGMAKVRADAEIKAAKAQGDINIKQGTAAADVNIKRQNAVKRVPKK